MNKVLKYVLIIVGLIFILVIAIPMAQGFLTALNPQKSIDMAKQKTAENKSLYFPEGYTLSKNSISTEFEGETLYVTEMLSGNDRIQVIEMNDDKTPCKGIARSIGQISICEIKGTTDGENLDGFSWINGSKKYQLLTNDTKLTDKEFILLMANFI